MTVGAVGLVLDLQATQSTGPGPLADHVVAFAGAALRRDGFGRGLFLNPMLPFPVGLPDDILRSPGLAWASATALAAAERDGAVGMHVHIHRLAAQPDTVTALAADPAIPVVVTVHDVRHLRDDDRAGITRYADLVLTMSDAAKGELLDAASIDADRVVVAGAAPSPAVIAAADRLRHAPAYAHAKGDKQFVLATGGDASALASLVTAVGEVANETGAPLELVVEGSDGCRGDAAARANRYRRAVAVIAPTADGVGTLSALDAAACGCPVLAPRGSTLAELLGDAVAAFDSRDPSTISAVIAAATSHGGRAAAGEALASAARSLTWDSVADRARVAVDAVERPRRPRRRRTVAIVGPWPPVPSGIARYNERVVGELTQRCTVDVYATDGSDRPPPEAGVRRSLPIAALGRSVSPFSYDAVVYTLGNSDHHHETLEVAERYPGIAWLHDVRLAGLFVTYAFDRTTDPAAFMHARLDDEYGERVPVSIRERGWMAEPELLRAGLGMAGGLLRSSRAAIVHSELARRMLALDLGPDVTTPPVAVVPHACPPRVAGSDPADPPTIVVLGVLTEVKAPDVVLDAFDVVRRRVRCRLAFVGAASEDLRDELERHAARLGVGDDVTFVDRPDNETYWRWLTAARGAVQLRHATHGESSGAVNDCLAAGIPVITSVMTATELPPETVDFVPPDVASTTLAERIERILTDDDYCAARRDAAREYASQHTFAGVAEALVRIIEQLPIPAP